MTELSVGNRGWKPLCGVVVTALMVGCFSEPPPPVVVSSPEPPVISVPTVATPWNADTLADGEFTLEEGFRALMLSDFEPYFAKPPQDGQVTWSSMHDAIICFGKPRGYLYSNETFADFTLRLEFRYAPPADESTVKDFNPNTGVMIYITEPHKQWPKSLEVQGRSADLATIKPNGGAAKFEIVEDPVARDAARKPFGDWNTLEVISKSGALTAVLNGTKVCESQPSDISAGAIGLQSEDFEIHFRRLRIHAE